MLTYAELSRREATAMPRPPDFSRETRASNVLDLVNLTPLMELTSGRPEIVIGLVDGPVVIGHPDLAGENIREIPGRIGGSVCSSQQHRLHARNVCGRDLVREEKLRRTGDLPRLHFARASDFFRDASRRMS